MKVCYFLMSIEFSSKVSIASENPVPTSPMRRSSEISTLSKYTSRVGDPRNPIFFSGAPNETPASLFSTTNAVIPFEPRDGSVCAITV